MTFGSFLRLFIILDLKGKNIRNTNSVSMCIYNELIMLNIVGYKSFARMKEGTDRLMFQQNNASKS